MIAESILKKLHKTGKISNEDEIALRMLMPRKMSVEKKKALLQHAKATKKHFSKIVKEAIEEYKKEHNKNGPTNSK